MFSLTCLQRVRITDEALGLTEPSGLALDPAGDVLWTVSDDTDRVFRLSLDGEVSKRRSFKVPESGLEGITTDTEGRVIYVVREESNEVLRVDVETERVTLRRRLADMAGYDAIAAFFAGSEENKGLEGITWNGDTGTLFALKEGDPGLLIEIDAQLDSVRTHTLLSTENGFIDDNIIGDRVDYSGICHDPTRRAFWIVSDRARRIFLYDAALDRVLHSAPLAYAHDGEYRQVLKAEGVAYDAERSRLYVVSDEEVRLYVFDVRR